jgi:CBS domain containing-hemolysin-like protein
VIEVIVVFVLLLVSGAFSGTEVAFTSLSVDQLERLKREKGRKGRLVAHLYDELDVVLTSITIGNNLANLAASALVSALTIRLFGETWLTVSTGVLTILVLIIGEVTPKQIGIMHNEAVTLALSRFLRVFSIVFAPIIWLVRVMSNALTRLTGGARRPRVTVEGLKHLVRYAGSSGILNQLNTSILKNVLRSSGIRVGAVITHRTKIFRLDKRSRAEEVFPKILDSGFSRVPVFDEDPEHIVGVVLTKDVARAVVEGGGDRQLSKLMVEPIYVPENRTIHQVLTRLRRERLNMAIVLDEYGGLLGLVTMEDLVEEFVGEIYDENEVVEARPVTSSGENEFTIRGDAPIYVVNDHLDLEIPYEGDIQTIAGYITEQIGRIPEAGERLETPFGIFTVEVVSRSKIERVRLLRPHVSEED